MKFEYLLLNLIMVLGPLILSFENKIRFVGKWRYALPAIFIVAIPYLIWDALVTGRHWWFNERYTFDFRLAGLPLEECLFFITVPFASLFTWEVIAYYFGDHDVKFIESLSYIFYLMPAAGAIIFSTGREYAGLMLIALGGAVILDRLLRTNLLLRKRVLIYLAVVIMFIMIFNSYLTWRPVVLYGEAYQFGVRLGTIPIEDFGYGISLLLFATIVYEKLKTVAHG